MFVAVFYRLWLFYRIFLILFFKSPLHRRFTIFFLVLSIVCVDSDPVLDDYRRNVPAARDPIVLSLFASIIQQIGPSLTSGVPRILESLFQPTIEMITNNFEDFPDHRINFFELLRAVNQKCFGAFFHISADQFGLVMNSISWAFKHLERNVADTGLNLVGSIISVFIISIVSPSMSCNLFSNVFSSLCWYSFFL